MSYTLIASRIVHKVALPVFALCFISAGAAQGQTFSSGSNGSDGALNYTTPGTYYFDPKSFNPPLNPAGDNVFNFTTINIGAGVTLKLSSKFLTGPVYWLATGAVKITGTVDLRGENGYAITSDTAARIPAAGGAGGYAGGLGGALAGLSPPQPGNGPGGGVAPTTCCPQGGNGTWIGSQYLIPLAGGSGGAGGITTGPPNFGAGGGGGGGAILIASPVSISIGGYLLANGGTGGNGSNGGQGGNGSGGAIRLIAPTVALNVSGDSTYDCTYGGGPGLLEAALIRVESNSFLGQYPADCNFPYPVLTSAPLSIVVPASPPGSLWVASIVSGGVTIPINANPFSFPDALINTANPVPVNVQAQYIPTGTVPKIIIFSENAPDQTVSCSALTGTLATSTCSASITFPTGGSRGYVRATW